MDALFDEDYSDNDVVIFIIHGMFIYTSYNSDKYIKELGRGRNATTHTLLP